MYNRIVQLYKNEGLNHRLPNCFIGEKTLNPPKRRLLMLASLAIVLVCAFAAGVYYALPASPRFKTIAFALGPTGWDTFGNSSVYSLGTIMNVTFQNGTTWEISGTPNISTGFNSTDITQILMMPLPAYGGQLEIEEHYVLALKYAFDWKIQTSLESESPVDLGLLDVANYTFSHYLANWSPPPGYLTPLYPLNYTLAVNTTGYWDIGMPPPMYGPWTWRIDSSRIHDLITNSTNPAEVHFDLDLTAHLFYQITTSSGTQSGYATVTWSGRWATLQLLHDGDQLLGFTYKDTDIGLRMMAS
jgi:hypothetical protein